MWIIACAEELAELAGHLIFEGASIKAPDPEAASCCVNAYSHNVTHGASFAHKDVPRPAQSVEIKLIEGNI